MYSELLPNNKVEKVEEFLKDVSKYGKVIVGDFVDNEFLVSVSFKEILVKGMFAFVMFIKCKSSMTGELNLFPYNFYDIIKLG